jgi:hypothetical protein
MRERVSPSVMRWLDETKKWDLNVTVASPLKKRVREDGHTSTELLELEDQAERRKEYTAVEPKEIMKVYFLRITQ